MKLFGRRSFLRVLGTAPLAGREAAEAVAKQLGQIGMGGASAPAPSTLRDVVNSPISNNIGVGQAGQTTAPGLSLVRRAAMRTILSDKKREVEIRAILALNYKRVHQIDHDIGAKRSWSLAAKVTFQRQRFVDEEMTEVFTEVSPWQAGRNWVEDQLKNFLLR